MPKFFIDASGISENEIRITGENVNHIKNVLRLKPNETIIVSDGNRVDYVVLLEKFESDHILSRIVEKRANTSEPPIEITLFQGIPKSDKMDFIIQKSVELGVHKIVPVMTERTIVRFDNEKDKVKKVERWQKIVMEAAKQCNRGIIPEVAMPMSFSASLEKASEADLAIIPYEKEEGSGLRSCLKPGLQTISVFIGPEGGFSEQEIQNAQLRNILPVTLGPRILRTETAGMAVISILMYELGDVGI